MNSRSPYPSRAVSRSNTEFGSRPNAVPGGQLPARPRRQHVRQETRLDLPTDLQLALVLQKVGRGLDVLRGTGHDLTDVAGNQAAADQAGQERGNDVVKTGHHMFLELAEVPLGEHDDGWCAAGGPGDPLCQLADDTEVECGVDQKEVRGAI